jgi:hypothetical protein
MKIFLTVIMMVIFLSGCATNAQKQLTSLQQKLKDARQQVQVCETPIEKNPLYENIRKRTPFSLDTTSPTIFQLSDNSFPSDEDIQKIISEHNDTAFCRQLTIKLIMGIIPGMVTDVVEVYTAQDINTADFIQKKLTWADFNRNKIVIHQNKTAKAKAAVSQIMRELAQSHQAELQQRQQALAMLANWSYQQKLIKQNQQLINSANRPVITNCTEYGNAVHCRSQ